jgi:hypothetical protein
MKMWTDPIVEETRRLREEYAAKHNHSVREIIADLQQWEKEGFPLPASAANEPIHPEVIDSLQRKAN